MRRLRLAVWIGAVGLAATVVACGGGYDSPTTPSPPSPPPPAGGGGGGGTPPPTTITVTVSSTGVALSGTTLAAGGTITWVNGDNRGHDMESNPHPEHTDCNGLGVGDLNPGERRTSGPITSVRTCGFHDHQNPGTLSLMGQITVQ